jgi:hypothetical protein
MRLLAVFIGFASIGWIILAIEEGSVLGWIVALVWIAATIVYVLGARRNRRAMRERPAMRDRSVLAEQSAPASPRPGRPRKRGR